MVSKLPESVYGGKVTTGISDDLFGALTVQLLDVSDVIKSNKINWEVFCFVLFYKGKVITVSR